MLDPRYVADNLDEVKQKLARRGFSDADAFAVIASHAAERRALIAAAEAQRAKRNETTQAMARADKKSPEFAAQRDAMREIGDDIKAKEERLKVVELELESALLGLPNVADDSTPDGASAEDNPVVRVWGEKPRLDFEVRDHVDVGVALRILDFERAGKISGARFSVLRGMGARLERALMMFMLDVHSNEHGYTEIWPPVLVKSSAMRGTGQLPKFAADAFKIAAEGTDREELYLCPTAEVPVTNLHADEILDGAQLPIAYTAYTACFRSEAGSYGKDTRGLIRQHQFDKVELVRFARPEDAPAQLELLTGHAEAILQKLGLHHRVVQLCAGDLGAGSRKTYDLEVWLPGQSAYREISSCSWFGDYQARRANIRFRPAEKSKPQLVHTLNGSALAIGRTLVAILEQCQQADGSVVIPAPLRPYMGIERITLPRE